MKKYFLVFVLLSFIGYSQKNPLNYDYFVQFNLPQIDKKIDIDSLLNHAAFKDFNREDSQLVFKNISNLLDRSKPAVIHGNFSDTINYYQISLPIKNVKELENYMIENLTNYNNDVTDSVYDVIVQKNNYKVYSPNRSEFTIAWNNDYLVFYEIVSNSSAYNPYDYDYTEEAVDSIYGEEYEEGYDEMYEEEYADAEVAGEAVETTEYDEKVIEYLPPPPPPVSAVEVISEEEWQEYQQNETAVEDAYVEEGYYEEDYEEDYAYEDNYDYDTYYEEERLLLVEQRLQQEEAIEKLFANGFSMPTSSKINEKTAISSWINYQSVYGTMSALNYYFKPFSQNTSVNQYDHYIKGMTIDMDFVNDKAVLQQTIEYSAPLAKIMGKVVNRKINKGIYNYFPKKKPLGYVSYHISSKDILKNYPAIAEQLFTTLPLDKKDTEIITDLFSTFIDEDAVASLLDGDVSLFYHGMEKYETTFTSYSYDDDYNETEEEKTITKTRPIFTMIMTSTHATMSDRLIDLGIRKNILVKENSYYTITDSDKDLEGLKIIKDNDVIVFTNGIEYLNANTSSTFSKEVKKDLRGNYFVANLDMNNFIKDVLANNDLGSDSEKIMTISDKFDSVSVKSGKKIKNNKLMIEMEMKSTQNNKNIILQMLDLASYLK